jgi:hypothetical protein
MRAMDVLGTLLIPGGTQTVRKGMAESSKSCQLSQFNTSAIPCSEVLRQAREEESFIRTVLARPQSGLAPDYSSPPKQAKFYRLRRG